MLDSDLAKQAWAARAAWPRKACFLIVAIVFTTPAISHCRAMARGSRYHEIYGWRVTFPDLKAAEATVAAKRHPPAKLINLTMLVSRTVTAIQPIIRGHLPSNTTEAQRQVLLQRRDAEIRSIEKKMLGIPAVVSFKLTDVALEQHGTYLVEGVLDWKAPLYLSRTFRETMTGGNNTELFTSLRSQIPSQEISFETDHQRVLGWTKGTTHRVYALVDSVRGAVTAPFFGGFEDWGYLRLHIELQIISYHIPRVATPTTQASVANAKFIVHLSNGGTLRASTCELRGVSYHIVSDGMVLDIPKNRVRRVEVIPDHVATTQPTAKH